MQLQRVGPVFARREYDEIAVGCDGDRWKAPLRQVRFRIGQVPPGEIHRARAVVLKLDPIRAFAVKIEDQAVILGHEFADSDRAVCKRSKANEDESCKQT